jgi:hypothetical protein
VRRNWHRQQRVAVLRARLAAAEDALAAGRPSIVVGGKRLWRNRNHLAQTAMTQQQWQARWNGARMFLTADGESGKTGGNETIRVDQTGRLRIKVPAALVAQLGSHLDIAAPVAFNHRGLEWADRVADRRAVRYDITFDPARNRWYLDASWKQDPLTAPPSIEQLRTGPVLGVDLNADHLACCILDGSGNPIGDPITIPIATAGLPPARRDIAIIGVDPAYTSKWGNQHWVKPLQQQTSEPVTGHHGAATAIGRRGLGLPIRRRPAGPRNGQRTVTGTPPARPDHQPNHDGRHGSSGPPPPTRWVAVHRRTPAASGQHRSGRNRTAHTAAHS